MAYDTHTSLEGTGFHLAITTSIGKVFPTAYFGVNSAIFRALGKIAALRQVGRWSRLSEEMAELLMNSAIDRLGSHCAKAMTNFAERTIWTGDNLDILRGLNSASVDLIYLDPPFNSNRRLRRAGGQRRCRRRLQGHLDIVGLGCGLDGVDRRRTAGDVPGTSGGRSHSREVDAVLSLLDGGPACWKCVGY